MAKQLARIKNVHFGVGDYGRTALWFDSYTSENEAALQVLDVPEAVKLIEAAGVRDVGDLAGKNVWVEVNGIIIKYAGYAAL